MLHALHVQCQPASDVPLDCDLECPAPEVVNFLNYFNNELCFINYKKEYVYNRTDYAIVQINLTPNNISIVVTRANGDI